MERLKQIFASIYKKYKHRHDNYYYRFYHRPLLAMLILILIITVSYYAGEDKTGIWAFIFSLNKHAPEKITVERGGKIITPNPNLLIKFLPHVLSYEKENILKHHNLTPISDIKGIDVKIVKVPASANSNEIRDKIISAWNEKVEFVETDDLFMPDIIPDDPWFINWQKNKQIINAPEAWNTSTGNMNIAVAIIDTGVDCRHEDLIVNCIQGWNFTNNNTDTSDFHGHGTKVAGIITAKGNNSIGTAGTIWHSKLMPIRVSDDNGFSSISSIANAIIYAADNGAKIANISYNVSGSRTVRRAGKYMIDKGGLVTVSAGNGGVFDGNTDSPDLIVVSATDASDNIYSWSNYGKDIDLSAPGCTGATTMINNLYSSFCGTSASAPEVAGLAALIWSLDLNLNPLDVENILIASAKDLGTDGWDQYYGWGRIDAGLAVTQALSAATTPISPQPAAIPGNFSITGFSVSENTKTTAKISWTTNFSSTGSVSYGLNTVNLSQTASDNTLNTLHALTLSNLLPNTKYYYQIKATNEDGTNSAASPISTFRTKTR